MSRRVRPSLADRIAGLGARKRLARRAEACERCPADQLCQINLSDPAARCPRARWT